MKLFSSSSITRRQAMTVTLSAAVIVYMIWNIAALSFLVYPLKLFVTYVHEAGHSSMALLTGGSVEGFRVFSDGSGVATTAGGSRLLILPAGYLGAAVFGALLFFLVNTTRRPRTIAILVGAGLIVFSLLYTIPGNTQLLALLIGIIGGSLLILLGWRGSVGLALLVLNILAIMTALNAVLDIVNLISHSDGTMTAGGQPVRNDAAAFADQIGILPASFWALTWAGLAIVVVGLAVYYSLLRPVMRSAGRAVSSQVDNLSSLTPRKRKE